MAARSRGCGWPTNSGGSAKSLVATVSPSGSVSAAQTALSGWSAISGQITLVPGNQQPQVIFAGLGPPPYNLNCVYPPPARPCRGPRSPAR